MASGVFHVGLRAASAAALPAQRSRGRKPRCGCCFLEVKGETIVAMIIVVKLIHFFLVMIIVYYTGI